MRLFCHFYFLRISDKKIYGIALKLESSKLQVYLYIWTKCSFLTNQLICQKYFLKQDEVQVIKVGLINFISHNLGNTWKCFTEAVCQLQGHSE